jgi:hypothetical protein
MKLTAIAYRFNAVICLLALLEKIYPENYPAGSNQARIRQHAANEMNN